jgi:hypothetical protein
MKRKALRDDGDGDEEKRKRGKKGGKMRNLITR